MICMKTKAFDGGIIYRTKGSTHRRCTGYFATIIDWDADQLSAGMQWGDNDIFFDEFGQVASEEADQWRLAVGEAVEIAKEVGQ